MDLRESITNICLKDALADITAIGRHWFSQPRPGAHMLETLLEEHGHDVLLYTLPPEWEHVIATVGQSHDKLTVIAAERAMLRDQGVAESALPQ